MSEALQQRRRSDRAKDRLAALAVSAVLALVLAAGIEGALLGIGMALGEPNWHRDWVDLRLKKSLEWLEGAPLLGTLASQIVDQEQGWLPGRGAWRDIMVLSLLLLAVCFWAGSHIGPTLIARYDEEALRHAPPTQIGLIWAGPLGPVQQATWSALATWCMAGMGTGRTPVLRPCVLPDVTERLSLAVLVGENGSGKSHLAEAFARTLNRDDELATLAAQSRAKAWALKLRVKWNELWWWRGRHPHQPWDCGYLVEDRAALNQLARFRPRRPTLLIADELLDTTLHDALQLLVAARVDFRHPVRLLVINVALPSALGLRFEAARQEWHTRTHDLGQVAVISLTDVRFQSMQFRALVGAQPPMAGHTHTHLMGRDAEWAPVTTALDEQPILLAEAIRWVRDGGRRYEDLQTAVELPHLAESMTAQQARRGTEMLEPDVLGKRRELLRERVLQDRTRHRQDALSSALRADEGSISYHALMVATAAGGGSASRLQSLLASPAVPLTPRQLSAAFGQALPPDWVPPIRPAVIADELLRMHFGAHKAVPLSQTQRDRVKDLVRQAWCLNPGGTRQTLARWQSRRAHDDFAQAISTLPALPDLQGSLDPGLRVQLARSFVELAVFNHGDLAAAQQALATLLPAERLAAHDTLLAVLLHPHASGVPALTLWLDLRRLTFPQAGAMDSVQAETFVLGLADEALHLLRQCVVVSVPAEATLEAALDEAAFAALPLVGRLGDAVIASKAIGEAASQLDRRSIGLDEYAWTGPANRLRQRLRVGLLAALVHTRTTDAGRQGWAPWVLSAIKRIERTATAPALDELDVGLTASTETVTEPAGPPVNALARAVACWSRVHCESVEAAAAAAQRLNNLATDHFDDLTVQEAAAQAWRNLSWAHQETDSQAAVQAAQKVAGIATRFRQHEGIQFEAAAAWRHVSRAHMNTDAHATAQAAQKVADIASNFQRHEGIQYEAAAALRHLSWAHKDTDAQATAQAAERVAEIATRFPQHEGIQNEVAAAWRLLSWAHRDIDAQATAQAAQKVGDIAVRFPQHEGIQFEAAAAWSYLSCAHKETDAQATAQAAQKVADIAARFQRHERIQYEAAAAWQHLCWAHKGTDAQATAEAAQRVADIAARFPQHEGIQCLAATAWRVLSWAHQDTDAQATAQAAQKVADIAARFQRHERIQNEAAAAWRCLAWAHKGTDPKATDRAAQKVADIAARFPQHEGIQYEAAAAWRFLSWAHQDTDAQATARATRRVADIAARLPQHVDTQFEAAAAWRSLSRAHMDTDAQASAQATQNVADIAARFPQHDGIQCEAAAAWRLTTLAAVKFDDQALIELASRAFDELAGAGLQGYRPSMSSGRTIGRVQQELELARVAVDAWRANPKRSV